MKIYVGEIYAFALGAALSWIITYLSLTREKRTIAEIKSNFETLAAYHELTKAQYQQIMLPSKLASNEEILAVYAWAVRLRADSTGSYKRLSPTILAAETIICQKLLGLTQVHAVRALLRTKNLSDLQTNLRDVRAEIPHEISN